MEPLVWTMVASAPRWPARRIFTISSKRSMGLVCNLRYAALAWVSILGVGALRGPGQAHAAGVTGLKTGHYISWAFVILRGARFLVRRRRRRHHRHYRHDRHWSRFAGAACPRG